MTNNEAKMFDSDFETERIQKQKDLIQRIRFLKMRKESKNNENHVFFCIVMLCFVFIFLIF